MSFAPNGPFFTSHKAAPFIFALKRSEFAPEFGGHVQPADSIANIAYICEKRVGVLFGPK
jgi:hypothetical protein